MFKFHGIGKYQWREKPYELTNIKIGIIGLGKIGSMVAQQHIPIYFIDGQLSKIFFVILVVKDNKRQSA